MLHVPKRVRGSTSKKELHNSISTLSRYFMFGGEVQDETSAEETFSRDVLPEIDALRKGSVTDNNSEGDEVEANDEEPDQIGKEACKPNTLLPTKLSISRIHSCESVSSVVSFNSLSRQC